MTMESDLNVRTNSFTSLDQISSHLIRSLLVEPLLSLVYDHHPVGDLRWGEHPLVDPSRVLLGKGTNNRTETYRFHAPSRGFWLKCLESFRL